MLYCKSLTRSLLGCALSIVGIRTSGQAPLASIQTTPFGLEGIAVCKNATVTFNSASLNVADSTSYNWLIVYESNPVSLEGPGPHEVTFESVGSRTVILVVDNHNGTPTSSAQLNFDVVAPPVPVVQGPQGSVCVDATFNLSAVTVPDQAGLVEECGDSLERFWSIADDLAFSLVSGSLGSDNGALGEDYACGAWEPGSEILELSVQDAGTFEAWLFIGSSCGYDSVLYTCDVIAPGNISISGDAWITSEIEVCSGDSIGVFDFLSTSNADSIFWEIDLPDAVYGVGALSGSGIAPIAIPNWTFSNDSFSPKTVDLLVSHG